MLDSNLFTPVTKTKLWCRNQATIYCAFILHFERVAPLQCKPLIRSDYSSCCPRDIDSKRIHHGQQGGFGLAVRNHNDVVGHDGDIRTSSTHDRGDVDGDLSPLL